MSKKSDRQEYLRDYMKGYNQSDKGKAAQAKYNQSDKGRDTRKTYYNRTRLLDSGGCSGVFLLGLVLAVGLVGCLLTSGCTTSGKAELGEFDLPVLNNNYDEDRVRLRAKELGIRPVDYLHLVNKRRIEK